jgi:Fe-S cluster assembly protein SufD
MSALAKITTEAERQLASAFAARAATPAQKAAFSRFEEVGLPHRRIEAWHYTDLRTKLRSALPFAPAPTEAARKTFAASVASADEIVIGFLDGAYVAEATGALPAGVSIHRGRDFAWPVAAHGDAVIALNDAFAETIEINVAVGVDLAEPIHIVSRVSGAVATAQRVLVRVGSRASVTLLETHQGGASQQKNCAVVIETGDEAKVRHVARHVEEGEGAITLSTFAVTLGAHCEMDSFALVSSGALTRRQLFVRFDGDHSRILLAGASLLKGAQHADTTLVVDHKGLHCESRERFKHIVDGEATGVYQGKVIVRPGAQKTDGAMKSDAILLSEEARMHNKPELEIFADDVVCGHGATVAQLDDGQLFYLMARGLDRVTAEKLLLEAFAGQVVETVADEAQREALAAVVHDWLDAR